MPNLGLARLQVQMRDGRSVVAWQYSQAPLQLHTPLYLNGAAHPTMFLRSPSAGFLDGDEHRLDVEVNPGATLELRTQAAALIYPGSSSQTIAISIADGGSLVFHPHPLILARAARFTQRIRIEMQGSARLDFRDSWSCGRIAMNERWLFDFFDNQIEIFRDAHLLFRERSLVTPCQYDVSAPTVGGPHNFFSNRFRFGSWPQAECLSEPSPAADTSTWLVQRGDCVIQRTASLKSTATL